MQEWNSLPDRCRLGVAWLLTFGMLTLEACLTVTVSEALLGISQLVDKACTFCC